MEGTCLNCGSPFVARRNTRKYCSDSCKQLAHYKRVGMELAGYAHNGTLTPEFTEAEKKKLAGITDNPGAEEKHEIVVQEGFTLNANSVDTSQKKNFTLKSNENHSIETDKSEATENKSYENAGDNLENVEKIKTPDLESAENAKTSVITSNQRANVKEELQLNDKRQSSDAITPKLPAKESEYKYISSRFLEAVEYCSFDEEPQRAVIILDPQYGWERSDVCVWVSLRFRCLAHTLIKLASRPYIDRLAIVNVAEAFEQFVNSVHFKCLPDIFPYTTIIKNLHKQMVDLAKLYAGGDENIVRFKLPFDEKVKLFAYVYELHKLAPLIRFTQLDFYESDRYNRSTIDENK